MVCELLCNLIGSSTSRTSLHTCTCNILLVVNKNKMAECFGKVNEQEIRELLHNTPPKILCLYYSHRI